MHTFDPNMRGKLSHWWQCPLEKATLLLLIGMIIFNGPWACIVRCAMLESTHQQHGQHTAVRAAADTPHAHNHHDQAHVDSLQRDAPHAQQTISRERTSDGLTVLTIAIMPPVFLLVVVAVMVASLVAPLVSTCSIALPPPHRPPRTLPTVATA